MKDRESIEKRAQAILAKAESAAKLGNHEEAQTYFAALSEMFHKYDLDAAALKPETEAGRKAINIVTYSFQVSNQGQHGRERVEALYEFIWAMGCAASVWGCKRNTYGAPIRFEVLGPDDVMERLKVLIPALLLQMDAAASQSAKAYRERERKGMEWFYRDYPGELAYKVKIWYRSVIVGYGKGVAQKVYERMQVIQEEAAGTGKDLVLLDRRTAVEKAYEELWPDLKQMREIKTRADAVEEGRKLGRAADLGDQRLGNERTSITA
ncbi:hypothetical protein [Nonomuraea sp. SYSU D8015]|uniref:hypothetical protein n=1 Tax=Nonomuraea sp. SYSU D8015 TaxID=2593644 RepID=UPI001660271B|nr:hypothetical protein [Nonomuraea sp. SYSU D8015]